MSKTRLSLAINVCILVILTIFGLLLSLPLQLLLNTNYYTTNGSSNKNETVEKVDNITTLEPVVMPVDFRKLKRCPRFLYEERLKSIFRSDYDGNCTYKRIYEKDDLDEKDEILLCPGCAKTSKISKEIVVTGHILVTMLVVSAIATFVEVLRIRFSKDQDPSKAGNVNSRKGSTIDLPVQRRFIPRQPLKTQRSFEIQGMHRSALRLLGARPPPLIRRSSFPTQLKKTTPISSTPSNRISRRQSAESEEEIGLLMTALHHRTRLIRRH